MKKIFSLIAFLFVAVLTAQDDKALVNATVDFDEMKEQIYYLSSDDLLGRDTGSEGIAMAADYIIDALKKYGAKPAGTLDGFLQEVPLEMVGAPKERLIKINDLDYEDVLNFSGTEVSHTGSALFLGYGQESDFEGVDVSGKYVMFIAGSSEGQNPMQLFNEIEAKIDRAKNAGAAGVIEMAPINPMVWGFLESNFNQERMKLAATDEDEDEFTFIWLRDSDGAVAKNLEAGKEATVDIHFSGAEKRAIICHNIVAMIEGTDPKLKHEYIIYGAHYDHEGVGTPDATGDSIYNGARDNVVGSATLLQMAKNLGQHPTKRSALFIFFTAEEKGLLGSNYYVNNPVLPLEDMVFLLNSDNAGYNDTSLITIFGLGRTTAGKHMEYGAKAFELTAIEDPAPEQNLFDRSDNVNFAQKGIPAPTFSMGFTAFDGNVLTYYHQPSDEADSLDFDYLFKFFRAYVMTGRLIANDAERPFWTEGDKYEAGGKALYGME